ncbi:MAG: family 1 encapsulin nanocompartment shell protein [Planctomycetota bacterium]
MSHKYLHRDDAPFGDSVWSEIDSAVVGAAKAQMGARKILYIDGPYGLGLKSIPGTDQTIEGEQAESGLIASVVRPLALLRQDFTLPLRDIATFEQQGLAFSAAPATQAAMALARKEDSLIFNGSKALGVGGLLNSDGVQKHALGTWDEIGDAAQDIIDAVTTLDQAGFHGPYSLALSPGLYNRLYRRYPQGSMTELEHLQTIVTEGVVKAPSIRLGGVLIQSGQQYARITIGQDLQAGFIGPEAAHYEFFVSESVGLDLRVPEAVCTLEPGETPPPGTG